MIKRPLQVLRPWLIALAAMAGLVAAPLARAQIGQDIQRVAGKMAPNSQQMQAESADAEDQPLPGLAPDSELAQTRRPLVRIKQNPDIKRILGENPDFIYDPGNKPDPMLTPWTQARVIAQEWAKVAERALKAGDWELAEEAYNNIIKIIEDLEAAGYELEAIAELRQIAEEGPNRVAEMREAAGVGGPRGGASAEAVAKLPAWIKTNTIGVIYDRSDPVALVGPYLLRPGDQVPRQRYEVLVERIGPDHVLYRIAEKTFKVPVNPEEGE